MENLGFIILRHVNSEKTNLYWNHSYDCVRKFYPEAPIMIIDDNSNYEFINSTKSLYKTIVVNSEFKGRGELLPYYYFLYLKPFKTAVIIHDSVFINASIDFSVNKFRPLWDFNDHRWDQIEDETRLIKVFCDNNLNELHKNKNAWNGCFGGMAIITHEYLCEMNEKYDISKLIPLISTRYNRCSFERVIACLLKTGEPSLLGIIHNYMPWDITYEQIAKFAYLPIIKVWTGR